jgi:ligand-binding sensor domain-containing protein
MVNSGLTNITIQCLAISGTNIFAGTNGGGVFLSTNSGTSWTGVNSGLSSMSILSLAIKLKGTYTYLSSDTGTSWTQTGLKNTSVYSFAVSGTNIFAGTSGGGGVYVSTDNGTSWTTVNNGLTYTWVTAFAVSGTNLFAGTDFGVYVSINNGTSWNAVNTGLTNLFVYSLTISGTNLFAGTGANYGGFVWRRPVSEMLSPSVTVTSPSGGILLIGNSTNITWTSIYVTNVKIELTTDNGNTWTVITNSYSASSGSYSWIVPNTFSTQCKIRISDAANTTSVYSVSNTFTILSTLNQWKNFNASNSGLPSNNVSSIVIDGSGNKWIGTSDGGLAKFDGTNWTVYNIKNSGLPSNNVSSIVIDGSGNKWIGTGDGGLAKFDGTNWTVYNTTNSNLPSNKIYTIAIDSSGNKWIGTGDGGFATGNGTNWTVYNSNSILGLMGRNYMAITIGSDGYWLGNNQGILHFITTGGTWTGYPSQSGSVTSIAIDGSGNKWVGTQGGFAGFGLTVTNFGTIGNYKLYTSSYGLTDSSVNSIAIDGSGNRWIGTHGGGLAKFNGTTGTVYNISNSGLPSNNISSIVIDRSGNKCIGTTNGGLAMFNENGVVSVKEATTNNISRTYTLFQNYPNPFNPTTTISFSLPSKSFVTLKMFDVLGKEVASIVSEEMSQGSYSMQWNASNMPSGVYFYRLQAGSFTETRKLVLLR